MKGWRQSWKALASFLLLYMLIASGIVMPLFQRLSYLVMQAVHFRYLTAENFTRFIRHPLVLLFGVLAALFFGALQLFAISGLLYLIDRSAHSEVSVQSVIAFAWESVKRLREKKNIGMSLIVLILMPILHFGSAINMLGYSSVFVQVFRFMRRHWYNKLIAGAVLLLLFSLFVRWMYACHYFVLEGDDAKAALRRSHLLAKGQPSHQLWTVLRSQILIALLYMVFNLLVIALIGIFRYMPFFSGAQVSSVQVAFLNATQEIFDILVLPIMLMDLTALYRSRKRERRELFRYTDKVREPGDAQSARKRRVREMQIMALTLLGACAYMTRNSMSQFQLRIEHLRSVEVSAHRGASMFAPENTMAAFILAAEQGADWIELDVQESKDGRIFVMHDESFKRTTGLDARSWQLPYYRIRMLDAGSFFNESFAGERIPQLSQVIEFAKEKEIRLNIELKPNGHEKDLVGSVLRIVEENEFTDSCVITSQKYDILRQVKKHNPNIETVYVMGLAYGAINRLKAADAFSIRSTSITRSLVTDLHNRGLEVYAWTVDSRENMNRMINLGVDNIITNNVPLAIECVNDSRTDSIVIQLLQILAENLRDML